MEGRAEFLINGIRNLCAHLGVARIIHIAVDIEGIFLFKKGYGHIFYLCRRRHVWVSQGKIIYVLLPELPCHIPSLFEHLPDDGIIINK